MVVHGFFHFSFAPSWKHWSIIKFKTKVSNAGRLYRISLYYVDAIQFCNPSFWNLESDGSQFFKRGGNSIASGVWYTLCSGIMNMWPMCCIIIPTNVFCIHVSSIYHADDMILSIPINVKFIASWQWLIKSYSCYTERLEIQSRLI